MEAPPLGDVLEETAWREHALVHERNSGALACWLVLVLMPIWNLFDRLLEPRHATTYLVLRLGAAALAGIGLVTLRRSALVAATRTLLTAVVCSSGVVIAYMMATIDGHYVLYGVGFSLIFWTFGMLIEWPWLFTFACYATIFASHFAFRFVWSDNVDDGTFWGVIAYLATAAIISVTTGIVRRRLVYRAFVATYQLQGTNRELEASLRTIKENQAQLVEAERKAAVAHYEREMTIARHIQTSILPRTLGIRGFDMAASMVTASEVGGDYYDIVPADDGGFWLGIGDVSGHGLNAGLMMMMLQSGLATLMRASRDGDPAQLVCQVNRMLYENMNVRLATGDYATLSLFRFFPDGRFLIAGAHEETLIWRARTQTFERIPIEGVWVGVTDSIEEAIRSREFRLEEGDLLAAYTDGIIEAWIGKEEFGLGRLEESIASFHDEPAARICSGVFDVVSKSSPDLTDDRTLLVIRRQSAARA
jgi:serine phosphatase RsbU (regulator of sigma subunit)